MRAVVHSKNGYILRLALETERLAKVSGKTVSANNYGPLSNNIRLIRQFGDMIASIRKLGIPVNTSQLKQFSDRRMNK